MPPIESLVVISPHLDDAVFSCGNLIAARHQTTVITVFAGIPEPDMPAPEWDRRAGFSSAAAAVTARRAEDQRALRRLDATPLWLEFFDSQYGIATSKEGLATHLHEVLTGFAGATIAAPLGLFHSDHWLVQQAALGLWHQTSSRWPWLFYEDALYRRLSGLLQERLAAWRDDGIRARPINLHQPQLAATKADAVRAYGSQLALLGHDKLADLDAPERYWQLECNSA